MAVLVTGGAGFVGLNLIERLLERGRETVAFDRRPSPEAAMRDFGPLPGTLHVAEGDVTEGPAMERVFADHAIDAVVHAAVITSGPERERTDGATIIRVNVLGTYEVLEAAHRHGAGRRRRRGSGCAISIRFVRKYGFEVFYLVAGDRAS